MSWWQRNRLRVFWAGLLILALALFQAGLKDAGKRNWLDRALLWVTAPVQHAVVWVADGASNIWHDYIALVGVREENRALRRQLEQAQKQLIRARELEAENQRLQTLLDLKRSHSWGQTIAARVVAVGTSPVARTIRIDAGSDQGVTVGDAVVGGRGLVGRVTSVVGGWAEVRLVVDGHSAVAAVNQRSRARGIIRGQGESDLCSIDYLVRTADVKIGDRFVTSVIGGVFPPGILIGEVTEVGSPQVGVFRRASLKPSERFERLEEVLVMPTRSGGGREKQR